MGNKIKLNYKGKIKLIGIVDELMGNLGMNVDEIALEVNNRIEVSRVDISSAICNIYR